MRMSAGKLQRLQRVAWPNGVIAAAAMDQRGSLQKSIAKEKGISPDAVPAEMMSELKTAVTRVLTPHASVILLDPEYGLEAIRVKAPKAGVLLAYEQTGDDQTQPGRIPSMILDWTVRKTIAAGADALESLRRAMEMNPANERQLPRNLDFDCLKNTAVAVVHRSPLF